MSGENLKYALKIITSLVAFSSAVVLTFLIEEGAEFFGDHYPSGRSSVIFRPGLLYQHVTTAGFREPLSLSVTLVTLRPGEEPGTLLNNVCPQRRFIARLLRTLAFASPAVIVIDKWYSPTSCPRDDSGTKELQRAVSDVSRKIPIVIAADSEGRTDLENVQSNQPLEFKLSDLRSADQILTDTLKFSGRVTYGLVRFNRDTRKIPLNWPTYRSRAEVGARTAERMPSLSVAAVAAFKPKALNRRRLKALQASNQHPFTSFFHEDQFDKYSAIEIVCGSPDSDWTSCKAPTRDEEYWREINSRVVLIAQLEPGRDMHETYIGSVPGYLLHANYIESLLDDRYLQPIADSIWYKLVWFVIIESLFYVTRGKTWWLPMVLTVFAALIIYIFAVHIGYYLDWLSFILSVFLVAGMRKLLHVSSGLWR